MSREFPAAAVTMAAVLAMAVPAGASAAEALRVVRDPQTGELRGPTAAEAAAFERAAAQMRAARGQKPAAPVEIRYPDGTVETKLGEDTHLYSVVSVDAKGALNYNCLPAEQARQYVNSGGKPAFASPPRPRASKPAAQEGKAHE